MPVLVGIFAAQILQDVHLTDIGAQRKQSTPTDAADAETIWLRRASQFNDRQVLPVPMIAHIKANESATVAGDRRVRRCA
jgi:6-pyruvoyl-tetrahydropterin synthase